MRRCIQEQRERSQGIMSLFGEDSPESFEQRIEIPDMEFDKTRRLAAEKEMLGLYVSDHPIMGMEGVLARKTTHRIDQLAEVEEGTSVKVGGVVSNLRKRWTRKGDQMASCDLEDMYGNMEVTLFPRAMEEHGHKLADDLVVVFEGRLDRRDDEANLICYGAEPIDPALANGQTALKLKLGSNGMSPERIGTLKSIFASHPGKSEVILMLGDDKGIKLSSAYRVDTGRGLIGELREMLGEGAVAV